MRWLKKNGTGWHIGIKLDEPLDELPLEEVDCFISEEDSCYLFITDEPLNTPDEALKLMKIIDALYESAASGAPVAL